jgi:hypothetical protein
LLIKYLRCMGNCRIRFTSNWLYKELITYIQYMYTDDIKIRLLTNSNTWGSGYLLFYRTKILPIDEYIIAVLPDLLHVNIYVNDIITEALLDTPFVRFGTPSEYYNNIRRKTIENIINHNDD